MKKFEYVKSLEKEVDELESEKADFSNIYDLLLEECVSKDVTCSYLHSLSDLNAYAELQCLYLHKVKECECLAQKLSKQTESVNKEVHNNLLKSFSKLEKHSISLELALQQSQMQDKNIAISELKKPIENCKGKSVETQFDKPSVVRQPNAQRIPKPSNLPKIRKQAIRNTNVIAPGPSRNHPKHVSFQSSKEFVGSNDMVHNYYLEKAKKGAQLQKDKNVNGKPSMINPARLPNTANGCNPKPRNWQASMSSRCLFSANHDECVLEYLSKLNPRDSAQNKDAKSHKTTKRYMPVEKSSASKKPERQIPIGHRFSNKKTTTVPEKTMNLRSCLRPRSSKFKRRLIIADQASVFIGMMSVHISSGLVLHQMTSDHNRSEPQGNFSSHSNEQSCSKLVPKVVPLAVKTATSRQELGLLFHLHIAMLRTTDIHVLAQEEGKSVRFSAIPLALEESPLNICFQKLK
ncbi:hypothetical protein Tco_0152048 [Tanacetum coccineum]